MSHSKFYAYNWNIDGINKIELNFNHPIKALFWTTDGKGYISENTLQLNGHDRFSERDNRYFNLVQPYQHCTNIPSVGINMYSFALEPEKLEPTGTCNFSRIDISHLLLNLTPQTVKDSRVAHIRIYALSYNILRISNGMGGLAYAN